MSLNPVLVKCGIICHVLLPSVCPFTLSVVGKIFTGICNVTKTKTKFFKSSLRTGSKKGNFEIREIRFPPPHALQGPVTGTGVQSIVSS